MPPKKAETVAAPKPKPTHGSYQDMITDAILALKDRNGSSRIKLKKYVKANNNISVASDAVFDSQFNRALKAGVEKGHFEQPKGPSGGTKLSKKAKQPPKKEAPKKVVPKKEPPKKKAAAPKKAAPPKEKKAAPPKKEAEKKAAPKKAAAPPKEKKVVAPKKEKKEKKEDPLKKTKTGRVAKAPAKPVPAKKAAPPKKAAPKKKEAKKSEAA
ncbi:uncharacterized protein MKZ38_001895 [Zalerion maritima]|uniref:Histone H1 n=1 Tax=Zalerion maritima TaxID=339359 RepID=A0AAD5WSW5_9PEZI|nr:uncharacterized protein MKZ38_001895 [Zalerion maritima]